MNKIAIECIEKYVKDNGYPELRNSNDFYEILSELTVVNEKEIDERRWWTDTFRVVSINDKLIGFEWAKSTSDDSPCDLGWEFDMGTICLMKAEEKKVVITKYTIIEDENAI